MDIRKLAKVSDSVFGENSERRSEKLRDSKKRKLKGVLQKKLMDTEDTEAAVEAAIEVLEDQEPAVVVEAAIEVLAGVIDELEGSVGILEKEVADARSMNESLKKRLSLEKMYDLRSKGPVKKSDAKAVSKLKKKLMDTEDTEGVIEEAKEALSFMDPESVIETVVEVLDEVIENLETSE